MSAYRAAIDLTIAVINQRSRIFRNQVVVIVSVALGALIGAIALRMLWPLTGLLALVPVCGLFLWFDTRRVAEWRSAILAMWARRDIELLALGHAIRAVPNLPNSPNKERPAASNSRGRCCTAAISTSASADSKPRS